MRAIWRLSINALAGRASRTALLIAAVALSVTLIATVATALGTLNQSMRDRLDRNLGTADVRVRELTGARFDASVADLFQDRPEVTALSRVLRAPLPLKNTRTGVTLTPIASGVDPDGEFALASPEISAGRLIESRGEILLGQFAAEGLEAQIGDTLEVVRFGDPIEFEVVGITRALSSLQLVPRTEVTVFRDALQEASGYADSLSELKLGLSPDAGPIAFADEMADDVPENVLVEPTERVTSGLNETIRVNRFFFFLASILAFVASSFIILTGLTTGVLERQRELAVMRAIGGARAPLAIAQLVVGASVGLIGAVIGTPLGVALAWALLRYFGGEGEVALTIPAWGLWMCVAGALGAGVLGALWPAIAAARTSPLRSFSRRAIIPKTWPVIATGLLGLAGLALQFAIVTLSPDGQTMFWLYALIGLPAMVLGYFLLGVPLVVITAKLLGPIVAALFRVPKSLLVSSVSATPYRNGFTAGALMVGLAIMTSNWTTGNAFLNRWLTSIEFPEAFVHGWMGLEEQNQQRIEELDFVAETCAITLFKIESQAFGVTSLKPIKTTFVAFEPEKFFEMASVHWVAGDREEAIRRVSEGGAVIVAKEFLVERDEYEVGDTFPITHKGETHELEIVGAVSSPGLDLVRKYFDIGAEYADQAINSVFGSRADLKRLFGSDAIHLIQVELADDANLTDEQVTEKLRAALDDRMLAVGSGREIIEGITEIGERSIRIANFVGLGAMLVGCFGVGNIVVASIQARRFEFGVVRAVGAQGATLGRLIMAEVLLISLAACVLGTSFGIQGAFGGHRLNRYLAGIELPLEPPPGAIAMGWGILIALTLGFVTPMIVRIARTRPRMLLASDV
jgi:putative ABC transport system permease protein